MSGKKGGAYLSSGSYACTFTPPLQCQKPTGAARGTLRSPQSNGARKVGKVFNNKKYGMTEVETQHVIASVDPEHLFTVNYYGKCLVGRITAADQINDCDKNIETNESVQIIYGHGGKDLWNVISDTPLHKMNDTFVQLFLKFQPVIAGLKRLNAAGYLHMDIKPDNIVFDGNKVSVIDFGLMAKMSSLLTKGRSAQLAFDYPYYPPEFKLQSVNDDLYKFQTSFMQNFNVISFKEESLIAKELQRYLAMSKSEDDGVRNFDKFNKSDIYSLGATLMILHKYMVTTDDMKTYIIKSFIMEMVNCNPYERSTWDDVLKKFNEIKTLLTRKLMSHRGASRTVKI